MSFTHQRDSDNLKLPPISAMDDYLPSRWIPPISSSPDSYSSSSPQPDHWKSPPYKSRHELKRDASYQLFATTNAQPTKTITTSPIMHQTPLESPSYFQYTSKAYHTQQQTERRPSNQSSRVENDIEEVVRQCNTLCDNMIQRKSQFVNTQQPPDLASTRPWLDDMIGRANEVLNALLRLRKHQIASECTSEHQRYPEQQPQPSPDAWRSASLISNNNKQRKRGKRPAFQGRCHSCNISETPEWRRGPDGARTLCNACGLHYAKLARKQQENRGMSSHILGNYNRRFSSTKLTPPADEIIIDKSPTG